MYYLANLSFPLPLFQVDMDMVITTANIMVKIMVLGTIERVIKSFFFFFLLMFVTEEPMNVVNMIKTRRKKSNFHPHKKKKKNQTKPKLFYFSG